MQDDTSIPKSRGKRRSLAARCWRGLRTQAAMWVLLALFVTETVMFTDGRGLNWLSKKSGGHPQGFHAWVILDGESPRATDVEQELFDAERRGVPVYEFWGAPGDWAMRGAICQTGVRTSHTLRVNDLGKDLPAPTPEELVLYRREVADLMLRRGYDPALAALVASGDGDVIHRFWGNNLKDAAWLLTLCLLFISLTWVPRGIGASRRRAALRVGRCPRCGYDIRDLPSHICPECGESWHKAQARAIPRASEVDPRLPPMPPF